MDRGWRPIALAVALSALLGGAALAEAPLTGVGALHQYCAGEEATSHPRGVVMRQVMLTDEMAMLGGTLFVGVYQRDIPTERTGRMVVRVRIERLDGKRERIGRFSARQGADGEAQGERRFPVAVRAGDMVIWSYSFRNFEPLQPDECLLLIGATVKP